MVGYIHGLVAKSEKNKSDRSNDGNIIYSCYTMETLKKSEDYAKSTGSGNIFGKFGKKNDGDLLICIFRG